MTVLELFRWQFGITTVYHFIFVPLTLSLSYLVAIMQTLWRVKKDDTYLRMTKFFGKIFLINFAVGVVTGIVQEFQFGMNWSAYSRFVGNVFGAPLAMEALLTFFLESTFIGIWIFGWNKLSPRVHLAAIWLTAVGTSLSAFFILAANSWMQHPVGHRGRAGADDGVAAADEDGRRRGALHHPVRRVVLAVHHRLAERRQGAVERPGAVPALADLHHDPHGTVQGINDVERAYAKKYGPGQYKPIIPVTYWSFRLMAGFGSLTALLAAIGLWMTRRRRVPRSRWFYRAALWGLPLPYLAIAFGWTFTEMSRQPWTVFGLLTTAQSVSPGVTVSSVIISLTTFTLLYAALAGIAWWLTVRHVKAGAPAEAEQPGAPEPLPVFQY